MPVVEKEIDPLERSNTHPTQSQRKHRELPTLLSNDHPKHVLTVISPTLIIHVHVHVSSPCVLMLKSLIFHGVQWLHILCYEINQRLYDLDPLGRWTGHWMVAFKALYNSSLPWCTRFGLMWFLTSVCSTMSILKMKSHV